MSKSESADAHQKMTLIGNTPFQVCARTGACCHGHQVSICPWELALLAYGKKIGTREFRDRYTDGHGTRLIFDGTPYPHGPVQHTGKKSCLFYGPGVGCTLHPYRPLACRLYPLGRDRHDGKVRYYHLGEKLSCFELCPSISEMPLITPDEYILDQHINEPAAAHDAYATLACGMITAAASIAKQSEQVDYKRLQEYYGKLCVLPLHERAAHLSPVWLDRLTLPDLKIELYEPAQFVNAHGQALAAAIVEDFSQHTDRTAARTQAAILYLNLGLHLGQSIGLAPENMAEFLE